MPGLPKSLEKGKKIYFASDFHLGAPDRKRSLEREKKIIRWLNKISKDADAIFLLGDIFDFWFEYKNAIPKGFIRIQGKLAELTDSGIPVFFFTGNHDMWMFDYFPEELNVRIFREPQTLQINGKKLLIGHGDGLGPGDNQYKILKKIFQSRFSQWMFARIHPNTGIAIANFWSRHSRLSAEKEDWERFQGEEKEFLWNYCREKEKEEHHDFYVFGHRHLPLDLEVGPESRYYNLGEWVNHFTYGEFDGSCFTLKVFKES